MSALEVARLTEQADRAGAEIAQSAPWPSRYPELVDLLALAYIRGGRDALQWAVDTATATEPQT